MAGLESTFQSIIPFLPVIQQGVGLVTNTISNEVAAREANDGQDLALRQLQERQTEQQRQSSENAALDKERIASSAEAAERQRRDALRRAVARQRANFGSSGISSGGGSAEAVLLGLFDETDADRQERERLDSLRFGAIDQNINQQRRLNVIQRTQLQQSQNIKRLSSTVDRASNFVNLGLGGLDVFGQAQQITNS